MVKVKLLTPKALPMKLSRSHSLFFSCAVYTYAHGLPWMCVRKPGVNIGISLSVAHTLFMV